MERVLSPTRAEKIVYSYPQRPCDYTVASWSHTALRIVVV